jgi:hypothetical protein
LFKGGDNQSSASSPEKLIAFRVVKHYREIFNYLDFNPVDDYLDFNELSILFKDFSKN